MPPSLRTVLLALDLAAGALVAVVGVATFLISTSPYVASDWFPAASRARTRYEYCLVLLAIELSV